MSNPTNNPEPAKSMAVKYKYRDIKVHSSDEWMADNTKKYRKVFDRWETTCQRVEFSFFNKLFDEYDREASVRLKCFFHNGSQKNELCSLEQKRKALKDENIVFIRDSWGNATPGAPSGGRNRKESEPATSFDEKRRTYLRTDGVSYFV
jgi:hypothetical protein